MGFGERSAATRAAILQAARERFAVDGYDRATIRSIAADAGVTAAMVIRYYGSKGELFALTLEPGFAHLDLGSAPREELGARFARAALDPWESGTNPGIAAVHRAAPTHEEAAQIIQKYLDRQVVPALRAALPDDPHIEERAALVHSQGLGAFMARYILRLEPLASMDYEEFAAAIGASVQHHLTRPMRP